MADQVGWTGPPRCGRRVPMASKLESSCHPRHPKVEAHRRTDNIAVALPHPSSCAPSPKSVSIVCTRTAHLTPSNPLLVPAGPVRQVQVLPLQSSTTGRRPDHHQDHEIPSSTLTFSCRHQQRQQQPIPSLPTTHLKSIASSCQIPAPRYSGSVAIHCWAFEPAWPRLSRSRLRSPHLP